MALVSAMHITAGVWVNDDEPGLHEDTLEWLDKVAPPSWKQPANEVAAELLPDPGDYRHHRGGEDNGDAHLKNLLVHHQVIVPVTAGRLDLGPWQQVFYCGVRRPACQTADHQGPRGVAGTGRGYPAQGEVRPRSIESKEERMEAGTAGSPRFAERGDGVARDADPTAPTVIQFPKVADPGPLGSPHSR